MIFFYTVKDIILSKRITKIKEDLSFTAPTLQELETQKINEECIYMSTDSQAKEFRKNSLGSEKKSIIRFVSKDLQIEIKNRNNFPQNLYKHEENQPEQILENVIKPLLNKKTIKVAIINGFGSGIGDSIVGLTAYRLFYNELQKYFDKVIIDLCQIDKETNLKIYEKETSINSLIQLPITLQAMCHYDAYIDLGGFISMEECNNQSLLDFFLTVFSLRNRHFCPSRLRNKLEITPFIHEKIKEIILPLKKDSKLLLFHPVASTRIRSIPVKEYQQILDKLLLETEYTIITAVRLNYKHSRVKNLSGYSESIDHLISIISLVDAIVTVDTSIYHISDCFNIPTVAIFSTIRPEYRVSFYPTVTGLSLPANNEFCGIHHTRQKNEVKEIHNLWKTFEINVIISTLSKFA